MRAKQIILLIIISGISIFATLPQKHIRIIMIGDSTMANKKPERYPEAGWGQVFGQYFTSDVLIVNRSINGASTKSFINKKQWQKTMDSLQTGDYLFIQFGHNDEKIENAVKGTNLEEFRANLTKFILEARSKEAIPVLLTPVERRVIKGDTLSDTHGGYPAITRQVAAQYQVPLIDLQSKSHQYLRAYGLKASSKLYLHLDSGISKNFPAGIHDNTHFNEQGAKAMAGLAADGIRELKLPLAEYLKR